MISYWKERAIQTEQARYDYGTLSVNQTNAIFDKAIKDIDEKINAWVTRYSTEFGVTATEAQKLLRGRELEEFRMTLEEYVRRGLSGGDLYDTLEKASIKFHISRLDALKYEVQLCAEECFGNYIDKVDSSIRDVYLDQYYRTTYNLGQTIGITSSVVGPPVLTSVIYKPWAVDRVNFSDRIWKQKVTLINELHNELTKMALTGSAPQKSIDVIRRKFGVTKRQAETLIRTELAHFGVEAEMQAYLEDDEVEKYQILVTYDLKTCGVCADMDDMVFKLNEYVEGVTAPPFHPNCRCDTAPYLDTFEDNVNPDSFKAARDKHGKTTRIPASMTYKEYRDGISGNKQTNKVTI